MNFQLTVALIAAGSALAGSLVGGISIGWAAAYAQRHQDRREKRQRVHASFRRVLTATKIFAAMTAPLQRGSGGGAWTPEQEMTEEGRRRFHMTLESLTKDLQNAAVELTLAGIAEPVAQVNELVIKFSDFRWHREGTIRPGASEEDWRVPAEASQAIAAIRDRLETRLPALLDAILPVSRGWRAPWRKGSS